MLFSSRMQTAWTTHWTMPPKAAQSPVSFLLAAMSLEMQAPAQNRCRVKMDGGAADEKVPMISAKPEQSASIIRAMKGPAQAPRSPPPMGGGGVVSAGTQIWQHPVSGLTAFCPVVQVGAAHRTVEQSGTAPQPATVWPFAS